LKLNFLLGRPRLRPWFTKKPGASWGFGGWLTPLNFKEGGCGLIGAKKETLWALILKTLLTQLKLRLG